MCKIASKYTKTVEQTLVDIAKQTTSPALVTYFEVSKKDIFGSLLLFGIYAKLKKDLVYPNLDL